MKKFDNIKQYYSDWIIWINFKKLWRTWFLIIITVLKFNNVIDKNYLTNKTWNIAI